MEDKDYIQKYFQNDEMVIDRGKKSVSSADVVFYVRGMNSFVQYWEKNTPTKIFLVEKKYQ